MSEILFRGKRIDNGEWVYGYLIAPEFAPNKKYIGHLFAEDDHDVDVVEVDPKTASQYTGLEDMNGRKIFEGDIVKLTDDVNGFSWFAVVRFGNPNCTYDWGWQLEPIGKCESATGILLWIDMEDTGAYCEVIGNIHDNPELMEVKQNDD